MIKDVTSQLLGAKRKESAWSEDEASRLANAVAKRLDGHVEWDGVACEDWISVKRKDVGQEPFFFFIYAYLPLILTSKSTIDKITKHITKECEVIIFNKYEEKEFRAEKGIIGQVFRTNRGMEDNGLATFSANNLYFHTV